MKKKILMIEDDLLACRAYQKLLEKSGYEFACALDGEEGLVKAHDGYDCILLDIALPTKDGWEILRELRDNDDTRHVPVIVCTVLDGDHHRKTAKELGADGFINKFNDEILSEVENVLKKATPAKI